MKIDFLKRHTVLFMVLLSALGFIVGEENGLVVVREDSAGGRAFITDIRTDSLPANDRAALRRGIRAGSAAEAAELLEDFDW
ncbi:MAG: hypothetical protein ACOX7P_01960 [Oscillospiraceae bacterium]|jgi:uncharacterized membrane protein